MTPKALLGSLVLFGSLALSAAACTVHVAEVGTVAADGSVYLGWHLLSSNQKSDREDFPVGDALGTFSTVRIHVDSAVALRKVVVIFADGVRFTVPVPAKMAANQWTDPVALPGAPRAIHSVVIAGKPVGKNLSKIEVYATH